MKRFFIAILVLCVSLSSLALAESLFPRLSTPVSEAGKKAPSYGALAAVDPDDIQSYDNDRQVVIYNHVDEQSYLYFGNYLSKLGFEAISSTVEDQKVEMMLSDGLYNIGMIYDSNEKQMRLIYEQGVEFADKGPFIGCTGITLGDEIEIKGKGRFRFDNFNINGNYTDYTGLEFNAGLEYYYYNTSTSRQNPYIFSKLVYTNGDNTYEYYGTYVYDYAPNPLEGTNEILGFKIPTDLQEARDGTLAIIIGIYENEKEAYMDFDRKAIAAAEGREPDELINKNDWYALILRENGRKVGDWESSNSSISALVPTTLSQENQAMSTSFPSPSKEIIEGNSIVPEITPALTVALADGICHYCGGVGDCSYCIGLGDCEHCFGEGTTLCETCFGSGNCQSCYGYGYIDRFVPSKGIEQIKCNRCSGNGKCTRCGGYGSIKCNYCGGSGACSYCKGAKKCQYCGGTGKQ